MAASLYPDVLDRGLQVLDLETTTISVCSSEPLNIATASTGPTMLGNKAGAAGSMFTAPTTGTPTGRQVASVQISDGNITTSGTANWWAAYAAGTLHAHGTLSGAQVVTSGNTFTLASFTIRIPANSGG